MSPVVEEGKASQGTAQRKCCTCCTVRVALIATAAVAVFILLVYLFPLQAVVANGLAAARDCNARKDGNTPEAYFTRADFQEICPRYGNVDLKDYFFDDDEYETVSFPSRSGDVQELSGYWFEVKKGAPVVIVSHGFAACKDRYEMLLPARMLTRNGYNVFAYDQRNHGRSASTDPAYLTAGVKERDDLLGAIDYVIDELKFKPSRVGLYGVSLGGAVTVLGLGLEPRISSGVFLDSPAYQIRVAVSNLLPSWSIPALVVHFWETYFIGEDIDEITPKAALEATAASNSKKPLFKVVSSTTDQTVRFEDNGAVLIQDAWALGFEVDSKLWNTEGPFEWGSNTFEARPTGEGCNEHLTFMLVNPSRYEQTLIEFFDRAF